MKIFSENHGNFGVMVGSASQSVVNIPSLGLFDDCIFVQGFDVTKADKKSIVQCFNGVNHVYAFGPDPEGSNYSVTFGVFMSRCSTDDSYSPSKGVADLLDRYKSNRVSNNPAIVSMNVDEGASVDGILTGFRATVMDASVNMASVSLVFTDLDA